jgi:hypothetical protein
VIITNERKLIEASKRLAHTQMQEDKRAAALYLVDQIRMEQEEKQDLFQDNQTLALQVSDLVIENQRL